MGGRLCKSPEISAAEALYLLDLAETAFPAQALPELAESFLHRLARLIHTPAAVLYLEDPALPPIPSFRWGSRPKPSHRSRVSVPRNSTPIRQGRLATGADSPGALGGRPSFPVSSPGPAEGAGLLGVVWPEPGSESARVLVDKAIPLLPYPLRQIIDRMDYEKQISNLNIYLNVSSMITQALDLREALEAVLYSAWRPLAPRPPRCSFWITKKQNFRFYSAEGPAKPVLLTASFPADLGLAGSVLPTQQSEIINDVQRDPRFLR